MQRVKGALGSHQSGVQGRLRFGHYYLAWEPGSGKTLAVIEAMLRLREEAYLFGQKARFLILTLNTTLAWEFRAEIYKWCWADDLPIIQVLDETNAKPDPNADAIITTYGLITRAEKKLAERLAKMNFSALVCDEAQKLKNSSAKRTMTVFGSRPPNDRQRPLGLWATCKRVWCLSGTPVPNDPSELWPVISRLFPLAGIQTLDQFKFHFCQIDPRTMQIVGGKNLDFLRHHMSRYWDVKRLIEIAPELPSITESVVQVSVQHLIPQIAKVLPPEIQPLVQQFLDDVAMTHGGENLDLGKFIDQFQLRAHMSTLRRQLSIAKVPAVLDLIEAEIGKLVVYSCHVEPLQIIQNMLSKTKSNPQTGLFTGATTQTQRLKILHDYAHFSRYVLLIQVQAGGIGLNLQSGHRAISVDEDWSPATGVQVRGRLWRKGQRNPVHVIRVTTDYMLDIAVDRALARKRAVIGAIVQ